MQQFEYKTYQINVNNGLFSKKEKLEIDVIEKEINVMGRKGWELVTQFSRQNNGFSQFAVLIFKRPLKVNTSELKAEKIAESETK